MRKVKFKVVTPDRKSYIVGASEEYGKDYKKDTVVHATLGSLGLMVFDTKEEAERWPNHPHKIIRVRPSGRGKRPKKVLAAGNWEGSPVRLTYFLGLFYTGWDSTRRPLLTPPLGTICYPAVHVLD